MKKRIAVVTYVSDLWWQSPKEREEGGGDGKRSGVDGGGIFSGYQRWYRRGADMFHRFRRSADVSIISSASFFSEESQEISREANSRSGRRET